MARLSLGLALAAQGRADQAAQSLDLFMAGRGGHGRAPAGRRLFAAGHTTLEQLARQERGGPASPDRLHGQAHHRSDRGRRPPLRPPAPGAAVSDLALSAGDRS